MSNVLVDFRLQFSVCIQPNLNRRKRRFQPRKPRITIHSVANYMIIQEHRHKNNSNYVYIFWYNMRSSKGTDYTNYSTLYQSWTAAHFFCRGCIRRLAPDATGGNWGWAQTATFLFTLNNVLFMTNTPNWKNNGGKDFKKLKSIKKKKFVQVSVMK